MALGHDRLRDAVETLMRPIRLTPALAVAATLSLACVAGPAAAANKKAKPKAEPAPGVILTATLLPGSHTNVEIPALPLPGGQVLTGTGVTRQIPMSGSISGPLVHRFRIGEDIDVNFKTAQFKFGAVDVLGDPACGGAPILRINPASVVTIDRTKPSSAVIKYSDVATAKANVMIRLAFDMRTEAGCDKPLVTTGYADTAFTDELSGKVGPRGLLALEMSSAPKTLTVFECLYPGAPDKPCAGGLTGYPVKVSVHVIVKISLKAVKTPAKKIVKASPRR